MSYATKRLCDAPDRRIANKVPMSICGRPNTRDKVSVIPSLLQSRIAERLRLKESITEQLAGRNSCTLLLFRIDQLWKFIGQLGEAAGDELLEQFGERLRQASPANGCVARLRGNDFATVLAGVQTASDAEEEASRLQLALRVPFVLRNTSICISIDVGIARAPLDGQDAGSLIESASRAVYAAKSTAAHVLAIADTSLPAILNPHTSSIQILSQSSDSDRIQPPSLALLDASRCLAIMHNAMSASPSAGARETSSRKILDMHQAIIKAQATRIGRGHLLNRISGAAKLALLGVATALLMNSQAAAMMAPQHKIPQRSFIMLLAERCTAIQPLIDRDQ
jgi:diguanylate cyclase (GGDEF)-like protein